MPEESWSFELELEEVEELELEGEEELELEEELEGELVGWAAGALPAVASLSAGIGPPSLRHLK